MIHSFPYSFTTQQGHSVTANNPAKGHYLLTGNYADGRAFTINYYDETFEGQPVDKPVALVASLELEVTNAFVDELK